MSNLPVKSNGVEKTIYNNIIDIKSVNVTLPELTLSARDKDTGIGGKTDPIAEYDATSHIPDGYEILAVLPCATSSNQMYSYYLDHNGKKIFYQYRNISYMEDKCNPTVKLLMIKRNK